ncbi:MAG: signal peptidase I [Caldilineales bacterium]|nr:signal peptidase I [Caldilineales bacterium]MCW5859586.1 signal peptidase I [Caldilineales bacterium]
MSASPFTPEQLVSEPDLLPLAAQPTLAPAAEPEPVAPSTPAAGHADAIWEILETLIIAGLLIVFFRAFIFQNYIVEGQSMLNTLLPGERVIVSRLSYILGDPQRGDVIVLQFPLDPERDFVKRIIGLPGETIAIDDGFVTIDGKPLPPETYVEFPSGTDMGPVQLAADEYFVMGDNRAGSSDSRSWGPLRDRDIIGKAWLVYFPFDQFGFVTHPDLEPQG